MSNPHKGEVGFEVDGAQYTLLFDYNAVCELEEEFDVDAEKLVDAIGNRAANIRRVFRIGLKRHHPMSNEEAGDIIFAIGPDRAGELITEAFNRAYETPEKGARPRKAGRG